MPWTAKQLKLFRAAAHNPAIAKSSGIKQADAERMSKEGLKKASGGLAKIGKQDTRHGKIDLPFHKLNRFAGMNAGGSVKKYTKGDVVRLGEGAKTQSFGEAFKEARASGADTFTWRGKKYTTEVAKSEHKSDSSAPSIVMDSQQSYSARGGKGVTPAGARSITLDSTGSYAAPRGKAATDYDQGEVGRRLRFAPDTTQSAGYDVDVPVDARKKGGTVKESKAMVKKEVGFMKKKGAPASMIKHEMAEMKGMKKGGFMRPKKDIAADQMAMAPYKKGGAMARGGGIESKGKTKGTMIKMAGGGYVRAADGCATKGKTKGKMV